MVKIKSGLRLRRRESGDYLKIDAAGHTKKLKEYFVNEKIPAAKRDAIWLLGNGVRDPVGGRRAHRRRLQSRREYRKDIRSTVKWRKRL